MIGLLAAHVRREVIDGAFSRVCGITGPSAMTRTQVMAAAMTTTQVMAAAMTTKVTMAKVMGKTVWVSPTRPIILHSKHFYVAFGFFESELRYSPSIAPGQERENLTLCVKFLTE
jgi:hypothetical protein